MGLEITSAHISVAAGRIRSGVRETELISSDEFSRRTRAHVWLKAENRQLTGSFKIRGALNKILLLSEHGATQEVIAASTGNHALGVAQALESTGLRGSIFLPKHTSQAKIEALRKYPVALEFVEGDALHTELLAKRVARERRLEYISPYNDADIISGQGTIGVELTAALTDLAAVYVTVGGGGLISGIAIWFAQHAPHTDIIGCLPEQSPEMQLSVAAGHIVHLPEARATLSDGSAGGCEDDAITFPYCQRLVRRYLLVSESDIARAMRDVYRCHGERIEGSAGVAVAAMLADAGSKYAGRNVAAVLCGGNVEEAVFQRVLQSP